MVAVAVQAALVAQDSPLPPAYPRPGATLMFENARVQVWNIAWLKQQYARHRHRYDLVGVYYAPGNRSIVSVEGNRRPVSTMAWDTAFQKSGVTHIEEGTSESPLRAVFIEMKEPAARDAAASPSTEFEMLGATKKSENERSIIWESTSPLHSGSHRHPRDTVVVAFEKGAPQVVFVAAGTTHDTDVTGTPERVYLFEMK
jgi:hypothetical protein